MSAIGTPLPRNSELERLTPFIRSGDTALNRVYHRIGEKKRNFNQRIVFPDDIMPTITTRQPPVRGNDLTYVPVKDIITACTFPQDYEFINNSRSNILFICGMSVPPIMIKRLVECLKPYIMR